MFACVRSPSAVADRLIPARCIARASDSGTPAVRCGNIKATIWQNVNEKGPFFATTFSRPFKDQSGEWRDGTSFGLSDLEPLLIGPRQAKS